MKKSFKAFTLIELIVVIAIFGILMTALMNFFRPVRETYVDSTLYEKQRTVHNGILEYLCESTRYAEHLRVYDNGATAQGITVNSAGAAFNAFCKEFTIDSTTYPNAADLKDAKYKVKIICLNRKELYTADGTYLSSGDGFHGRIIANIFDDTIDVSTGHFTRSSSIDWAGAFDEVGARCRLGAGGATYMTTYMALGGGYYGRGDYSIYVDKSSSKDGLVFGVISQERNKSGNVVENSQVLGNNTLDVTGDYLTLKSTQQNITKNLEDFTYYRPSGSEPYGTLTSTGTINGNNKNTYIVFTIPDEGR